MKSSNDFAIIIAINKIILTYCRAVRATSAAAPAAVAMEVLLI